MIDNEICLIVTGRDARDASEVIKKIVKDELHFDVQMRIDEGRKYEQQNKAIDSIAIGALILSIPAAILAFSDLIERIKNKKKLDNVLDKIQKQVVQKKEVTLKIQYPDGVIKEISTADTIEILDNLSE